MKLAVSSKGKDFDSEVDPRFGRCPYFLVVDTETMNFEALSNESAMASGGAGIQAAQDVAKAGVDVVLTGNIGPNAFQTLKAAEIKVITGVIGTVRETVEKYKSTGLEETKISTVDSHFGEKENKETTGEKSQKICIPTMGEGGPESLVGDHFGRVPNYTIVELDTNEVKIIPNTSHHMGGQGYPPELMKREGVSVMVCKDIGMRAIGMFEEFGIEVYIGATGTVKDAVDAFKKGLLQKATRDDACREHAFRGQD